MGAKLFLYSHMELMQIPKGGGGCFSLEQASFIRSHMICGSGNSGNFTPAADNNKNERFVLLFFFVFITFHCIF